MLINISQATNIDWANETFLPLSGGNLTGDVNSSNSFKTDHNFIIKVTDQDRDGTVPSADQYSSDSANSAFRFYDKDDQVISYLRVNQRTSNGIDWNLLAWNSNTDGTGSVYGGGLGGGVKRDGTSYYYVSDTKAFCSAISAVQKNEIFNTNTRLSSAAPSSGIYGGGFYVRDSNNDQCFYSEMAKGTDKVVYRSFVVRRYDSSGANPVTNGFYLRIADNGTPSVTFTSGGAKAWCNGIGALPKQPVSADLPQSTATSNVFPLVLGNTFANNGQISYMNVDSFRTMLSVSAKPTQLYYNATGTTGTVTLSSSAANYNHMCIYYYTNDGHYHSVDVYSPNGKKVTLSSIASGDSTAMWIKTAVSTISGKSITRTANRVVNIWSDGSINTNNNNNVYIFRVEGWNE